MKASIYETQEWFRKISWEAEGLFTEVAVEGQTCDVVSSASTSAVYLHGRRCD